MQQNIMKANVVICLFCVVTFKNIRDLIISLMIIFLKIGQSHERFIVSEATLKKMD